MIRVFSGAIKLKAVGVVARSRGVLRNGRFPSKKAIIIFLKLPVCIECMVQFNSVIKKFASQGEKTGWTYLQVPSRMAEKIKPGTKKSFRVKGQVDDHSIEKVSLLPMGDGSFILPLNKSIRKGIGKYVGATVKVLLSEDKRQLEIYPELIACLKDEPSAFNAFNQLAPSHQRYFSKWITEAKTEQTRIKRIAKTVNAMINKLSFGDVLKSERM